MFSSTPQEREPKAHADLCFERIRAVAFDCDGVLLESTAIKTAAFLELFSQHSEHLQAIRDYHLDHTGISRYDKFKWIYETLLRQPLGPDEALRLGERYTEIVLERVLDCPFVPGTLELLQALWKKLPMFVVSGTPQEELERILGEREIDRFFSEIFGSPSEKGSTLCRIQKSLSLEGLELLFIGDGQSDYEAAVQAGTAFILRTSPEQGSRLADLPVHRVRDLRGLEILLGQHTGAD